MKKVFQIVLFVSILTMSESMGQEENTYLSVRDLFNYCDLPAPCDKIIGCEGKTIRISGYIDWKNIFFKEEYPQIPYEKFMVNDPESEKRIEVFVNPKAARVVYRMIQQQMKTSKWEVFVEGTISVFNMPLMGPCYKGIRIELEKSEDIKFR